jgi:uncharacterized protein (TIGR04255 family)
MLLSLIQSWAINRIVLPEGRNRYEDFLNVYPQIPGGRDQAWASWAQRVEIVREDLNAVVTFQAGTHHEMPELEAQFARSSVILDISYAPIVHHHLPLERVKPWLEKAHAEIENLFFQSVTERCLKLFEPVEVKTS